MSHHVRTSCRVIGTREKGKQHQKLQKSLHEWDVYNPKLGVIERGVPHRGVPQKCVRGRASGAMVRSGHVLRVFLYSTVEARRFDTYQSRFGYISDTYQCALLLCLEAAPEGYPPGRYPPYDYSRKRTKMQTELDLCYLCKFGPSTSSFSLLSIRCKDCSSYAQERKGGGWGIELEKIAKMQLCLHLWNVDFLTSRFIHSIPFRFF